MSKRTVITNKGLELLASSSEATGQFWWIGYYGLAYVPNFWKETSVSLPSDWGTCENVNGTETVPAGMQIESGDTDQVTASMTRLTKYGDVIYNIFQGDLVGTGYYNCVSDGSAGGDLFGLTMYNTNIKKHYRYVLDQYGNNTLVTWIDDPDTSTGLMLGQQVYLGTDGFIQSAIPIPAPLYYLGDTSNDSVDNYFPDFENEITNGSNIYPYLDLYVKDTSAIKVPKISVDCREYLDSQGYTETHVYGDGDSNPTNDGTNEPRTDGGQYFDSLEITPDVDTNFDNTSWFAANLTMLSDYGESPDDAIYCKEFWRIYSISNYNKYHAPVNSTGSVFSSDLSNRNMAKVTKFFPISNYKVITTQTGSNSEGDAVDFATGISVTIDLDLAPRVKNQGFDDACDYDETANLTFFDKYDLTGTTTTQTDQKYYDGSDDTIKDQFDKNIFNTSHTSFKFNRIGIYAVSLRKCPFIKDEADPTGKDVVIQFEIDPDVEPILFAVIDWDNTVTLDDTGDGIHQFRADINLNLESPAGNLDADELVRDSTIFYNMYEDDALTWYQNQLIANASTQNAITEMQIQIGHLETKVNTTLEVCPPTDLSKKFSAKNHNHSFEGLRHLYDGVDTGSLRGNNTKEEGSEIILTKNAFLSSQSFATENYSIDDNSTILGNNTYIHSSVDSSVHGTNNYIYDSEKSAIISGESNKLGDNVYTSVIAAGSYHRIAGARASIICAGYSNTIKYSNSIAPSQACTILTGTSNTIETESRSVIGGGYSNSITGDVTYIAGGSEIYGNNLIGAGRSNTIRYGSACIISGGFENGITDTNDQTIANAAIVAGNANEIDSSDGAFIGAGGNNEILNSSVRSAILAGYGNTITYEAYSSILSGQDNTISQGTYNAILGGVQGTIYKSTYSAILNGTDNYIYADNAIAMGNNAKASAYGEIVNASGFFSEQGDAQRSQLLFRGTSTDENIITLGLDGIYEYYDFSKNYSNRYVSFSGKANIMGNSIERTLPIDFISHYVGTNYVTATFDNIHFFMADIVTDGTWEIEITDTGVAELDVVHGSLLGNTLGKEDNLILIIEAASVAGGDYTSSTGNAIVRQISNIQIERNFIGTYNGIDDSLYIHYSEPITNLAHGMFTDGAGNVDFEENMIVSSDGISNLYVRAIGAADVTCKWLANIDMLTISGDPS